MQRVGHRTSVGVLIKCYMLCYYYYGTTYYYLSDVFRGCVGSAVRGRQPDGVRAVRPSMRDASNQRVTVGAGPA